MGKTLRLIRIQVPHPLPDIARLVQRAERQRERRAVVAKEPRHERVRVELASVAEKTSQRIAEHLANAGDVWAKGLAQDDDVTLVVLKMR